MLFCQYSFYETTATGSDGLCTLVVVLNRGVVYVTSYHYTFTRGMTDSSGVSNFSGIDGRTVKPCPGSYDRTWTGCVKATTSRARTAKYFMDL